MNPHSRRRLLIRRLGVAGALLGIAAGIVQVTVGAQIPEWSGAKNSPVPLGLLTVGLALVAGLAAVRQARPGLSPLARTACALGQVGPGLLCLSTVGRLWYLPAALLISAGILTIESWRYTGAALAKNWYRVLLSCLGGFEVLMVVSAGPVLLVVGGVGGLALIVAAWLPIRHRAVVVVLAAVGAVPFAVLGRTAVVPVLDAALTGLLTVLVTRGVRRAHHPRPGGAE